MSTLAVTNALESVFLPIGIAGAVIALLCALVMTFALARGAAGLTAGAAGVWIVGALLSLAASFGNQWMPALVAVIALVGALVLGAVLRAASAPLRERAALRAERRGVEIATAAEPATVVAPTALPTTGASALPGTGTGAVAIA